MVMLSMAQLDELRDGERQPYEKRIAELEAAMRKAITCINTNLYHQREKVEDAAAILRDALSR
jgi:hypothetical protein